MKGDRDGLLDALTTTKDRLYRAQTLLLDCYAAFDDALADGLDINKASSVLVEIGFFLESVPWEKEPASDARQEAITFGDAPQVQT